ncbi:MAG: FtsW/RodA/SpoVE family cell cycle protein [Rikenellaceae bacterium]
MAEMSSEGQTPRLSSLLRPSFSWFKGDRALWIVVAILAITSVLVVYSSTAKMAYDSDAIRTTSSFLRSQIFMLVLAGIVIMITHRINMQWVRYLSTPFFVMAWLATFAVYFLGSSTNGASRWIMVMGFQFQPSEMLKVATLLMVAKGLDCFKLRMKSISIIPTSPNPWRWFEQEGFMRITLPIFSACGVILFAHTSSAALLFLVCFIMLIVGRIPYRELKRLVILIAIVGAIYFVAGAGRSATAGGRVTTWLEIIFTGRSDVPAEDLYDTERAMIAINSGGFSGVGAGQSAMRVEMIHPESDYAYAFFIEEYGLILGIILLLSYIWIMYRTVIIVEESSSLYATYVAVGCALLITIQALAHVMVATNLMPETGQTLPMVSRGGSSLLFTAMALGLILGVSRQNDEGSHV